MANQPNQAFDDFEKKYKEFVEKIKPDLEQKIKDAKSEIEKLNGDIKTVRADIDKEKKNIEHYDALGIPSSDPGRSKVEATIQALEANLQNLINQRNQHRGELAVAEQDLKQALTDLKKDEQKVIGSNQEAQDYMDIALGKKYDRALRDNEQKRNIKATEVRNLETLRTFLENDKADCKARNNTDTIESRIIAAMRVVRENDVKIKKLEDEIKTFENDKNQLNPSDPNYQKDLAKIDKKIADRKSKIEGYRKDSRKQNVGIRDVIQSRTGHVFGLDEIDVMMNSFVDASLKPRLVPDPNRPGVMIAEKDADGHIVYEDAITVDHILPAHDSDSSCVYSRAHNSAQRAVNDLAKKEEILQNALTEVIRKHPEIPFDTKSQFLRDQVVRVAGQQFQQESDQLQQEYDQITQRYQNSGPNFNPTDELRTLAQRVIDARAARDAAENNANNLPVVQRRWYQFIQKARDRRERRQAQRASRRANEEFLEVQGQATADMQAAVVGGGQIDFTDPVILNQIINSQGNQGIVLLNQAQQQQLAADSQRIADIQQRQGEIQQETRQQASYTGREPELTDFQKRVRVSPYVQSKLDELYREGYKKSKADIRQQNQQQQNQQQNGQTR